MVKRVTYSVDEDTLKKFNDVADEKTVNRSKWLEKKMEEFIKEGSKK